jgi:hypothetical protein
VEPIRMGVAAKPTTKNEDKHNEDT